MVQHQLYATMPKYVLRLAGEGASPSWYANVNPLVVVLTVNLVTRMMRKRTALTSMTVGMFIMPVSALCMASGNMLDTNSLILGMHPVAFMMVVGIVFQGLAETFISPRFLEYFSLQAPKGEEGLYLGFSHLHSFLSSIFGFGLSGFLLSKYCPEPTLFASHEEWLGGKRKRSLHLVLLRCDSLGLRYSVDRVRTSRKEIENQSSLRVINRQYMLKQIRSVQFPD